jgi:2-methylaconitate cis-trans-isomerase PrpF
VNAQYKMEVIVPPVDTDRRVSISGVPGEGIPLEVYLIGPKYGNNNLLPTGNVIDKLELQNG